jgi:pilus assembly protein Flp/PilA
MTPAPEGKKPCHSFRDSLCPRGCCVSCATERGTTAIEYALIASGISIVIAGTIAILGGNVKNFYSSVAAALQ